MVCIHCHSKTQVTNSRLQKKANKTWRRRRCVSCNTVFTTLERPLYEQNWVVITPEGSSEPFSRDKLMISLYRSLKHREKALEDAASLTETIIQKLIDHAESGQLHARLVSNTCQVALNRFDKVASTHYQAFHTS